MNLDFYFKADNLGVSILDKIYKKDPENQNIRLAPTQVKNSDLKKAMDLFVTAVCLAG